MSKGALLVLGASVYQLEVIRKAKELGFDVVTTDNVPDNPGHRLADQSFGVDTTDSARVLELARTIRPRGVIAPCTDVAVTTCAVVAEALGLRGVPPASAEVLTSKILFRRFLADEGLPAPRFWTVEKDAFELPSDRPVVIKPEGSSGSKGIFIVRDREELRLRLPETLSFSPKRRAIVEEYIDGHQGTCEGVVVDGRVRFALFTDRATASPPFVVTAGHSVPSRLDDAARVRTQELIARVLEMVGVKTSPFDCDFVVGRDGAPYLLELTPRLGGNSLTNLVRAATGLDLAEIAVRLACGDDVSLPDVTVTPAAQLILGAEKAGELRFDEAAAAALREEPWVRALSFDYPRGHRVSAFINGRTRIGEATLTAHTRDELDERVRELKTRLRIDTVSV